MWLTTAFAVLIDLLLVAGFLAIVITFLKYGFARTIYKIGKTWLSVVCSMLIGPWLADLLQRLFIRKGITNGIYVALDKFVTNNANGYNLKELFENLPEGFSKLIGSYGVSFSELETEFGSATVASPEILQEIAERLSIPCVDITSSIIGHAVGFVIPLIFFWWLNLKIRSCRNTFFRFVDRVGGLFAGICVGYVAIAAGSMVLQNVFQLFIVFDMNSPVVAVYEKSWIFRFLSGFDTLGALRNVIRGLLG